MPQLTGNKTSDGLVELIAVPADKTIQVWAMEFYLSQGAELEVLVGDTVVFTANTTNFPGPIQPFPAYREPLIQGVKGQALKLDTNNENDTYYNIQYTLI